MIINKWYGRDVPGARTKYLSLCRGNEGATIMFSEIKWLLNWELNDQ